MHSNPRMDGHGAHVQTTQFQDILINMFFHRGPPPLDPPLGMCPPTPPSNQIALIKEKEMMPVPLFAFSLMDMIFAQDVKSIIFLIINT